MKKQFVQILLILCPIIAYTQKQDTLTKQQSDTLVSKVFQLGEVTITSIQGRLLIDRITHETMEEQNRFEVSKVANLMPGVHLTSSGPRNESMITIRGFDLRAVPVFMDGIPVYVPYDGYVDLSRFTTFDLSAIDISKGFTSVLHGPNIMGGALNLISRKPSHKIEADGSIGMINTNGFRGNVNIGANFKRAYIQAGYSYLHRAAFALSENFQPHKHEDGGNRENSYRTDQKVNLKIGWTPNEKHEYVLGFIYQQGSKGSPVYAGDDTLNSLINKPRYWQWPNWDKTTFFFLSNTKINEKNYIKTRIYYDIFKNTIESYDDSTYTTMNKPYAFKSKYNDYTYGAGIEYGTTMIPKNELKFSAQYKQDVHRENNVGDPVQHFTDHTFHIAIEDVYNITKFMSIIPGISYSGRQNTRAVNYDSANDSLFDFDDTGLSSGINAQLGIFFYFKKTHNIGLTGSRRTRFATIKDRYSYRMGTAIPNPGLKPETSYNVDLTYKGTFFKKLSIQASFFYSRIADAIISVDNVLPSKSQMQNTGSAEFIGAEVGVCYNILKNLLVSSDFTYIHRKNITNPNVLFTDVPDFKVFSYIQYKPIKQVGILLSAEYNSARYSKSYGVSVPQFVLINALISGQVWRYLSLEIGVNNIADQNYMITEGYPEEGRNFFFSVKFSFNK